MSQCVGSNRRLEFLFSVLSHKGITMNVRGAVAGAVRKITGKSSKEAPKEEIPIGYEAIPGGGTPKIATLKEKPGKQGERPAAVRAG